VVRVRLRSRAHRFFGQDGLLTSGQRDQCDQWSKEPVVKTAGADSKASSASASACASGFDQQSRDHRSKAPVVKGASGQRS
jgi:hypothetical protein